MNQERKGEPKVEQGKSGINPSTGPGAKPGAGKQQARRTPPVSRPAQKPGLAGQARIKDIIKQKSKIGEGQRRPDKSSAPVGAQSRHQKNSSAPAGKTADHFRQAKPQREVYRVEGVGRKGMIRHVKIIGSPGQWQIIGLNGLFVEVTGATVSDAIKRAGRRIPFRPIAIRRVNDPAN